eukprot:gene11462-15354_t
MAYKGTLEERVRQSSKRGSAVYIQSNPLDNGAFTFLQNFRVELLADAKQINEEQLNDLLTQLKNASNNQAICAIIEREKNPYLFNSEDLTKLLDVTTSLPTKKTIINLIVPRLSDPRAKLDYFVGLFRFVEDKTQVEEVFKNRTEAMRSSLFKRDSALLQGRGGRGLGGLFNGGGGRGLGGRNSTSPSRSGSVNMQEDFQVLEEAGDEDGEDNEPMKVSGPSSVPFQVSGGSDGYSDSSVREENIILDRNDVPPS